MRCRRARALGAIQAVNPAIGGRAQEAQSAQHWPSPPTSFAASIPLIDIDLVKQRLKRAVALHEQRER